jgi:hypothetical protein
MFGRKGMVKFSNMRSLLSWHGRQVLYMTYPYLSIGLRRSI